MTIYKEMKIKTKDISFYNNLMYNNVVFKLERVNARDMFNQPERETAFKRNIDKLNGTLRADMINELNILRVLLKSHVVSHKYISIDEFSKDANYSIHDSSSITFVTKSTNIRIIEMFCTGVNDKRECRSLEEQVEYAIEALNHFKKLGRTK